MIIIVSVASLGFLLLTWARMLQAQEHHEELIDTLHVFSEDIADVRREVREVQAEVIELKAA